MTNRLYFNLWARLMAGTEEPENSWSCWTGSNLKERDRYGYHRVGLFIPGRGSRKFYAHRIVHFACAGCNIDDIFELCAVNQLFNLAQLEVNHLCRNTSCRNPDHLVTVTKSQNAQHWRNWRP